MFKYSKNEVIKIAKENKFIVNTIEKVLRLNDILYFINNSKYSNYLILKGGTAINLCIFNLPRLSVDADFDFGCNLTKEETKNIREDINDVIKRFMIDEGYTLSNHSKFTHSLDSFVFSYDTLSNSKDILKIEINYSNRLHVLESVKSKSLIDIINPIEINRLKDEELFGSKINALISRTTARDVFDTYMLFKEDKIKDINFIKKITIFYLILGNDIPFDFTNQFKECIDKIKSLNYNKIRDNLIPVLHLDNKIDIEEIKEYLTEKLSDMFILDEDEKKFINEFNKGNFNQELLFKGYKINDLSKHPMIRWKLSKIDN